MCACVCVCLPLWFTCLPRVFQTLAHIPLPLPLSLYIYLWLCISVYIYILYIYIYVLLRWDVLGFRIFRFLSLSRSNTSPALCTAPASFSSFTPGRLSCIVGAGGCTHAGCDDAIGQRLRSSHVGVQAATRPLCGVLSLAVGRWCGAHRHQVRRTHDVLW